MGHEKLRCYRNLVDVAARLAQLIKSWPRGYGYLVDQIQRAIASAVLNVAEGNGKSSPKERKRFFQISLGSIAEVSAALDLCRAFNIVTPIEDASLKSLLMESYNGIRMLP
jgi:four helix bundle protein